MNDAPLHPDDRLALLVDRYLDGALTAEESAELNFALLSDPATRDHFVELMIGDRALAEAHRTSADRLAASPESRRAALRSSSEAERSPWGSRRIPFAIAAALLISAAAVAVYVFVVAADPPASTGPQLSDAPIATLIGVTGGGTVLVDDDVANPGAECRPGVYTVDAGAAEFMLTNRVAVTLTGRTTLTIHSNMAATLDHGSAEFVCPPGAKGFRVNLPDGARVVDLGTAFRVSVEPGGATSLRVDEGRVRYTGASREFVLDAGASLRRSQQVTRLSLPVGALDRLVDVDGDDRGDSRHSVDTAVAIGEPGSDDESNEGRCAIYFAIPRHLAADIADIERITLNLPLEPSRVGDPSDDHHVDLVALPGGFDGHFAADAYQAPGRTLIRRAIFGPVVDEPAIVLDITDYARSEIASGVAGLALRLQVAPDGQPVPGDGRQTRWIVRRTVRPGAGDDDDPLGLALTVHFNDRPAPANSAPNTPENDRP